MRPILDALATDLTFGADLSFKYIIINYLQFSNPRKTTLASVGQLLFIASIANIALTFEASKAIFHLR
jgi:hypothetical protein